MCSLSPPSATIALGGTGSSTLTVNTTAAKYSSLSYPKSVSSWKLGDGGVTLVGQLMCCVFPRRRRWLPLLALLLMTTTVGMIGCAGGSSTPPGSTLITPATASGSYAFSVTGTDSTNSTITTSTSVAVTVQ
jgi:hypothetical protein